MNYVLRGMLIPSGKHNIEFKFEPTVIDNGNTITLTSYLLLIFIPIGWYFYDKKKKTSLILPIIFATKFIVSLKSSQIKGFKTGLSTSHKS